MPPKYSTSGGHCFFLSRANSMCFDTNSAMPRTVGHSVPPRLVMIFEALELVGCLRPGEAKGGCDLDVLSVY